MSPKTRQAVQRLVRVGEEYFRGLRDYGHGLVRVEADDLLALRELLRPRPAHKRKAKR